MSQATERDRFRIDRVAAGSFKFLDPPDIKGTGYEAAIGGRPSL
ncbi:MAG: hypothetical protein OXH28_02725 [bacterium]|nr:hypothetical protein [bacterium]